MTAQAIPVRRMPFSVPDTADFHPVYLAGNAGFSYAMTGMGLYVALLEPFIVKSVRRVLDRVTDPGLREAADRFSRQEAQHYQQHERFNTLFFSRDYPGLRERYERLRGDFERFLAEKDDRFRIGFVEGFEANTTQGALSLLGRGLLRHPATDKALGSLWEWHMLEEIEHRNIAFDLYEHLFGGWPYRALMCWRAQHHMATFIDDVTAIMNPRDIREFGDICRITSKDRTLRLLSRAVPRVKSMLPGYSPHRYELPAAVQRLADRLTSQATSVS
ncbi:MAG: metal-dependent hydrolase [Pseudomonadales bacterium]|nr:metal-dependent hydrolase [Pseudomonadales bacterium]